MNPAIGGVHLNEGVRKYVQFYNQNRRHTSIENKTQDELYYQMKKRIFLHLIFERTCPK